MQYSEVGVEGRDVVDGVEVKWRTYKMLLSYKRQCSAAVRA